MDREKVINKVKAIVADMQEEVDEWKDYSDSKLRGGLTCDCDWWYKTLQTLKNALAVLKAQEPITGETSDGYHTFNELYHHRAVLFSVIVANYPDRAWKSKKHHDGTMYENMFIVGIDTPDGQATYHYDVDPYWDMFKCRVLDNAPEWDGHTPAQAIERIGKLKAQEPRLLTLDEIHDSMVVYLDAGTKFLKLVDDDGVVLAIGGSERAGAKCFITVWDVNVAAMNDEYNVTWRAWSERPTKEQREGTLWE